MRGIKFLAIILMLAFAGFVYAEGRAQESKKSCGTDKANCCASCCKMDGDSCCKAHNMGGQQQSGAQTATQEKKAACDGCACCKDGKSCCGEGCKMDKMGKMSNAHADCCDMKKDGAACAGGGCACCSKDKAKTN